MSSRRDVEQPVASYAGAASYLPGADPWLGLTAPALDWLLKLSLLTSKRVVLSDNQVVNSPAFQRLLARDDVFDFFATGGPDNLPSLLVSIRDGASSFYDVLASLVIRPEQPAIFRWLPPEKQSEVQDLYAGGHLTTLEPFLALAGDKFASHIERLERLTQIQPSSRITWHQLPRTYLPLVREAATGLMRYASAIAGDDAERTHIGVTCASVRDHTNDEGANRSSLSRVIERSQLSTETKRALELRLLDEPYHRNFAAQGEHSLIAGLDARQSARDALFTELADEVRKLKPVDVREVDTLPLSLAQVPYERVFRIRESPAFLFLIERISKPEGDHLDGALVKDLLHLIDSNLAQEPRGLKKLTRLRIRSFVAPSALVANLHEIGLTFSDVLGFLAKTSGFLVGEGVGSILGGAPFLLGGLSGLATGIVVEEVMERVSLEPQRRREAAQISQLLGVQPQPTLPSKGTAQ
jgi:hypothetical protein